MPFKCSVASEKLSKGRKIIIIRCIPPELHEMNAPESKIDKLIDRLHSENMSSTPSGGRATPQGLNLNFSSRGSSARRPQNLPFTQRTEGEEPDRNDRRLKEIMKSSGKVKIRGITYNTELKDMEHIEELGYGTCGHVVKMRHTPSGDIIAVKQMRRTGNNEENKRIVMDIEVVLKSHGCPYIVQCLGCFITEAEVWICMELMATCFDKLLKRLGKPIPEHILGKVTVATVKALAYLKDKHGIIHRDVKPSNILLDERGNVKLCDFGISGRLVDSMALTKSAGCTAYLAPERIQIDPKNPDYDIRADVWSLGITLVELATGLFPYQDCKNDFEVLAKVVTQDPPTLPTYEDFSTEFRSFVNCCLIKDQKQRPKYVNLKEKPFYKRYEVADDVNVGEWFVNAMSETEGKESSSRQTKRAHTRQHSEPPPRTATINGGGGGRSPFSPTSDASETRKHESGSQHVSRITSFQREMVCEKQPVRTYSPFLALQNHLQAKNSCPQAPRFSEYMQQERYTSPIMHRRSEEKRDRWNSPVSTSLTRNQEELPYNSGNTSPLVLQRFYHQQKQQQQAKEAEDYIKNEPALGRKRIASYIKLQLNNDRSGRSSRHQSPEPPPRLNRGNGDSQSPLALRRHFYENSATTSPVSSRRYISPTPPVPPPRRLSESTSVPGSPQHVRARFHYTPEPQRRLFQNNDVS